MENTGAEILFYIPNAVSCRESFCNMGHYLFSSVNSLLTVATFTGKRMSFACIQMTGVECPRGIHREGMFS